MADPTEVAQQMYEGQAPPGSPTWAQLIPAQQQAWINRATAAIGGTSANYIAG